MLVCASQVFQPHPIVGCGFVEDAGTNQAGEFTGCAEEWKGRSGRKQSNKSNEKSTDSAVLHAPLKERQALALGAWEPPTTAPSAVLVGTLARIIAVFGAWTRCLANPKAAQGSCVCVTQRVLAVKHYVESLSCWHGSLEGSPLHKHAALEQA